MKHRIIITKKGKTSWDMGTDDNEKFKGMLTLAKRFVTYGLDLSSLEKGEQIIITIEKVEKADDTTVEGR